MRLDKAIEKYMDMDSEDAFGVTNNDFIKKDYIFFNLAGTFTKMSEIHKLADGEYIDDIEVWSPTQEELMSKSWRVLI